jgi:iron complex outermembrane recepter protein
MSDIVGRRLGAGLQLACAACVASWSIPTMAQQTAALALPDKLRDLSVEELTRIEVTSASKRAEPLSAAPTALFVITGDDIRRSGYTSLAEALRLAPNLDVQRITAREYAITARGFGGYETARHLLVLIDGRSIYSTLFSGVFWELRDLPLDDIDRIEVISGPGGTLYGLNAVNGVINIITKEAPDTQGFLARATAGADERTALLRYGGKLGESGAFRAYVNAHDRDDFDAPRRNFDDGGEGVRAGFRTDWGGGADRFTFSGDIFDNDSNRFAGNGEDGGNLMARWTRSTGNATSFQVQAYYDTYKRRFIGVSDKLETIDLEAQANWTAGRHNIVAGIGARTTKDEFVNTINIFQLDPVERRLWLGNMFVQDRFALTDRLSLIAGLKLEKTSFTDIEVLPNLRLAYQPNDRTLFWSAVSRAVRTPSRIDRDLTAPGILLAGTFSSEKLTAIEAGYRGQPTESLSLSVSLFYNFYDGIRTTEPASSTMLLPVRLENGLKGETFGIEAWATGQLAPWWRVSAGIATLDKDFELKAGHVDIQNGTSLGNDADFQTRLRSQINLGDHVELDAMLRSVDGKPNPRVRSHAEADVRLAWRPSEAVELFVAGRNLLHDRFDESGDPTRAQLIPRSVVAGTRLTF